MHVNIILEKLSPEDEAIRNSIVAFEELTSIILHTMEYWDRKTCTLTKPLPTGQKGKKGSKVASKKGDNKSPQKKTADAVTAPIVTAPTPQNLDIGVPCWLVRDTDPDKAVEKMIAFHLKNDERLLEAFSVIVKTLSQEVPVESTELFSILRVPRVRKEKNVSKVFLISDICERGSIDAGNGVEEVQVTAIFDFWVFLII